MSFTEKELAQLYRQLDAECAREADKVRDARDYEPHLFVPTAAAKEAELKAYAALEDKTGSLPAPDPVFAILRIPRVH